MDIRVLGASGAEAPGHNSPAFLVDDFLLLDAGTVGLSLENKAQCKITHILLTHAHLDHIKGIPSLVDNIVANNEGCRLTILSGKDVLADLQRNIFNNRIWPDFSRLPTPEHPVMRYQPISTRSPFDLRGYRVHATRVNHVVPAYGYLIATPAGKALVYSGDSGPTQGIWKNFRGYHVKAVIVEVSFPNELESLALASGHLTPALLEREIAKMATLPEKLYISHIKPHYRAAIEKQLAPSTRLPLEILEDNRVLVI